MREEQKRIITQLAFPTVALFLVFIGMIIHFNIQNGKLSQVEVEGDIIVVAERYSAELYHKVRTMSGAARTLSGALAEPGVSVPDLLSSLCLNTPAYMAIYTDSEGNGINQRGEDVQIPNMDVLLDSGANTYVHLRDDGLTGTAAIAHTYVVTMGEDAHWLISYYPLEDAPESVRRTDLDRNVLYMLMDSAGNIMVSSPNYQSNYLKEENLINQLRSYREELRMMERKLKDSQPGGMKVELNGEARSLIYAPFPLNNWYVMIGVGNRYVDRMEMSEWEFARNTLIRFAVIIAAYIALVILISIISKIRNTAKTKELMEKADTDQLTGLLNKVATENKVSEYMAANPTEQAVMYVLDIDNFKKINDTMGHAFGDDVLKNIGERISPIFRASDIIGRIGGDEFCIMLKNIGTDEIIIKESTKVARFFHDFKCGEYTKYSATASIGTAIFPRDGKDFEAIYKAADQALYMAKKRGKNQLAFYHDSYEAIVIK